MEVAEHCKLPSSLVMRAALEDSLTILERLALAPIDIGMSREANARLERRYLCASCYGIVREAKHE